MTQPANRYDELSQLIFGSLEGSLDAAQAARLQSLISTQDWALKYYCEYITLYSDLKIPKDISIFSSSKETLLDPGLWRRLQQEERNAPTVPEKRSEQKPEAVGVQDTKPEKVVRKISKTSIFSLYAAAAAIILIFVFAYFAPPATGLKVAVLSDSIHAKWADADGIMEQGASIFTSRKTLVLQEGYAELLFDNKARVTLEGPAEFQILTNDQIRLQRGRLYAIVPQEAIGFTVTTQMAKVIDLGTEFGVESDTDGDTYLHVIKGKIALIGGKNSTKASMEVGTGYAKKVSSATSAILDIPCNANLFVRKINSQNNVVWKGQKALNLADIVGGGDGFGAGKLEMGIDPVTGQLVKGQALPEVKTAANGYISAPASSYIDGVFIPNGRTKQMVSSQGHSFEQCPVSGGSCYGSIINAIRILDPQTLQNVILPESLTVPCILMHANMGITYDLGAIRDLLPGVKIVRFQSKFGIEKEAIRPNSSNADFWILVDGKLRHQKTQVKENPLFSVDLELSEKDRFLTLVTTDGGDPNDRKAGDIVLTTIDSDWCMFAEPVLILE